MKFITRPLSAAKKLMLSLTVAAVSHPVLADGIPTVAAGSDGSGETDYVSKFTGYAKDGIGLIVLLICAWGLIRVASNALTTYGEITDGKATYKDLGLTVIIGAVLVTAVIFILNNVLEVFN